MAVTFDLRSQVPGDRYVSGVRRSLVCKTLHVGQFVAILVSKSARALCRPDSGLFCECLETVHGPISRP